MELLYSCRDHAHNFYYHLLSAAKKSLADALFEKAECSKNDVEQRRLFETIQQLKNCDQQVQDCFRQTLEKNFQGF